MFHYFMFTENLLIQTHLWHIVKTAILKALQQKQAFYGGTIMDHLRLETERLILRNFHKSDMDALFALLRDEEVNTFLPWFPVKNMEETRNFYEQRFANNAYCFAICFKEKNDPIGYITADQNDSHEQPKDFPVLFRMYQLNLDGQEDRVYQRYWNMYDTHFIEQI